MKKVLLLSVLAITMLSASLSYAASEWGVVAGRPMGYTVEIDGVPYLFKPSGIRDKYFKFSLTPGWPFHRAESWKRCEQAFFEKRGNEFVVVERLN